MRAAQIQHLFAFSAFLFLILERFHISANSNQIYLPRPDLPPIFLFLISGCPPGTPQSGLAFISNSALSSLSVFLIIAGFWLQPSHWLPGPQSVHDVGNTALGCQNKHLGKVVGNMVCGRITFYSVSWYMVEAESC